MPEMTPERKVAWEAEQKRKATAEKARHNASRRAKRQKAVAKLKKILPEDTIMEQRWLDNYLGAANGDARIAARMAGFAENFVPQKAVELKRRFARQIAAAHIDKDTLIARVYEGAIGPGVHFVRGEEGIDLNKTLEKIEEADAKWLMTGFKKGRNGHEVTFRNPDVYMRILADAAGIAAPKAVDVNVQFAQKTPEEKAALREAALQKVLALRETQKAIEGDFRDDSG